MTTFICGHSAPKQLSSACQRIFPAFVEFGTVHAQVTTMKNLTTLILGLALTGVVFSTGCTVSHESSDKPGLLGGENHSSSTEVKDLNGNPIVKTDSSSHTSN